MGFHGGRHTTEQPGGTWIHTIIGAGGQGEQEEWSGERV